VDVVENILDPMREGRRYSADFWINLGVAQDVTTIKELEGEKRLLDGG
jgi:DUF438 domain-containing protein